MGRIVGQSGTIIIVILVALVVAAMFLPQIRQMFLNLRSDEVTINRPTSGPGAQSATAPQELQIITVLGRDGIPAILDPEFLTAEEAAVQMDPSERVIGVSVNGEHRAYPLNLLSRHEIVNDTFGVSGKLIMNALVMYDHQSDTLWSQFLSRGVKGPLAKRDLEIVPPSRPTGTLGAGFTPTRWSWTNGAVISTTITTAITAAGIIGESNRDRRLPGKDLVLGLAVSGLAQGLSLRGHLRATGAKRPFRRAGGRGHVRPNLRKRRRL